MYIGTFLISVSLIAISMKHKREKNVCKLYVFLGLLLPALLAGLRDYTIGYDVLLYGNYWFEMTSNYDSLTRYLNVAISHGIGPGYAFINYLCSLISPNPHFFYFIFALLQMIVLYFAIKDYNDTISVPFAFFIYYLMYFNSSLNILRQSMAIILIILSYKFAFKKKLIIFLICVILAASFHTTAIIAIILYPLNWVIHSSLKKIGRSLFFIASTIFVFAYDSIFTIIIKTDASLFDRYSHYLNDEQGGGRFIRLVFWGIFLILYYWKKEKIRVVAPKFELLEYCLLFSFLGSLINLFSGAWMIRAFYYFDCASVFSIPLITKVVNVKVGTRNKNMNYIIVGMFVFAYWLITYVIRNGGATFPYQFMKN